MGYRTICEISGGISCDWELSDDICHIEVHSDDNNDNSNAGNGNVANSSNGDASNGR